MVGSRIGIRAGTECGEEEILVELKCWKGDCFARRRELAESGGFGIISMDHERGFSDRDAKNSFDRGWFLGLANAEGTASRRSHLRRICSHSTLRPTPAGLLRETCIFEAGHQSDHAAGVTVPTNKHWRFAEILRKLFTLQPTGTRRRSGSVNTISARQIVFSRQFAASQAE